MDTGTILDGLKPPETKEGKFRLQNKRVHLTYPTHIDPEQLLAFVQEKCPVDKYSIVNETSETNGYQHTHAAFWFERQAMTSNCRFFDYEGIHPNIKKVTTPTHWNNVIRYHAKQGEPFTNEEPKEALVDVVWRQKSMADALRVGVKKPGDVVGTMALFKAKPKERANPPKVTWRKWQKQLYNEIIGQEANDRKVIWYLDSEGAAGKSYFARHMFRHEGAFITDKAEEGNIQHALRRQVESTGNPVTIMVLDFPRHRSLSNAYGIIESIKNMLFFSGKYQSGMVDLEVPSHMIVFSNTCPDLSKLSLDRWDLRVFKSADISRDIDELIESMRRDDGSMPALAEKVRSEMIVLTEDMLEDAPNSPPDSPPPTAAPLPPRSPVATEGVLPVHRPVERMHHTFDPPSYGTVIPNIIMPQ